MGHVTSALTAAARRRRAVTGVLGGIGFIIVFGSVATVDAKPEKRVLILPLVSDFLPDNEVRQLDKAVREEVESAMRGYTVLPRPALDLGSMKVAAGCAADGRECLALIARTARARWVVQVGLRGTRKRGELRIDRVDSRRGRLRRYDALMNDVGRASQRELRWHVAKSLGRRPPPLTGRLELVAQGPTLDGARIQLDGVSVGADALRRVSPGLHRVVINKAGFRPFSWVGAVRPGRRARIQVRLVRAPPPPRRTPYTPRAPPSVAIVEEPSNPVWTWVLGGGALVAAGAATVFGIQVLGLESDAEDANLDCSGADRDDSICEDGRSRALMTNVAFGVAGGLAVGAVIAYLLETAADDESETAAQVGVSPTGDGMAAAVRLRF